MTKKIKGHNRRYTNEGSRLESKHSWVTAKLKKKTREPQMNAPRPETKHKGHDQGDNPEKIEGHDRSKKSRFKGHD